MTQADPVAQGSTLYYCLVYSSENAKQAFLQCSALIDALNSVLHDVNEAQIAQKKIHWWHEEIDRAVAGNAKHPATEQYQSVLSAWADAGNHCLNILSTAAQERYGAAKTYSELNERITLDYVSRLTLLHHAVTGQTPDNTQWHSLALALGLFDRLADLRFYLHRSYDVFSQEHYGKNKLSLGTLASCDTSIRTNLLNAVIDEAVLAFEQHYVAIAKHPDQKPCLPISTMAQIRHRQLLLWKKQQPDLLAERVVLTPLKKFFIAWRSKRQY